jgi:hypothetical protein
VKPSSLAAIDDLKATASKDRLRGIRRKRGYSNASLAIDIYFDAKENTPGEILSRSTLSEYRVQAGQLSLV